MLINFSSIPVKKSTIAFVIGIAYFVVLIRTAWVGDDAIFTLRSILNFLNGYGPNFNLNERVQSYTHPLWFLLLSIVTLITKNPFSAAFISSFAVSLTAFWFLLTNKAASTLGIILAGSSLLLSKAFIDYSTSGLENPLTNLLLLLTFLTSISALKKKTNRDNLIFFLCCSLVYLSRADAIIFIMPIIFLVIYHSRNNVKNLSKSILLGSTPFVIWSLFSFIYYGSIFPNTAYAKLNTGIPLGQLLTQGLLYFIDSIGVDPITIPFICIGLFLGLSQEKNRPIAIGIILYLAYILYIGGDFMSGRFFAAPMFLSAYIISTSAFSKESAFILISVLLIFGIPNIKSTLLSDHSYDSRYVSPSGIADERGYYYESGGLLKASRRHIDTMHWPKDMKHNGNPEVLCSPALSTIDQTLPINAPFIINCALSDPLLSRLPVNLKEGWRIGHYYRKLPDGYKTSIATDSNQIHDPIIHRTYDAITKITRGSLWDIDRLKTIFLLNFTDQYDPVKSFLKNGIDFNQEPMSYFITRYQGLSGRESWGRWSDTPIDKPILIEFLVPLPKKFILKIEAKGFDRNIGQYATIKIGGVDKKILLEGDMKKYEIPIQLLEPTSNIEIFPPNPISPNDVDAKNPDTRKLGVGIKSISFAQ